MCGRFGLFRPQGLASRFGVSGQMPLLEAAYNITPESMHPVITGHNPRQVSLMNLMATIHNRMPVILPPESESLWLDPTTPLAQVLALLQPYPASGMEAYPVSDLVNSPRNRGRELIEPLPAAVG